MSLQEHLLSSFPQFLEKIPQAQQSDRKKALEIFAQKGFPTKKDEEYKYTSLKEITGKKFQLFPAEAHSLTDKDLESYHVDESAFDYLIFINGVYHEALSKVPKDYSCVPMDAFLAEDGYSTFREKYYHTLPPEENALTALHAAYARTGVFIHIPENCRAERPLHLFYLSDSQKEDTAYTVRNLLVCKKNSHVEVLESHHNRDSVQTFTHALTEIFTDKDARADWHKLQNDSPESCLLDHTFVKQEESSQATVNTFSFGGKLVRNNLDFIQNGEHIHSFMNGITIIGNTQLVDHHTAVHHNKPNCESYQNYKGIYDDNAKGVFNGKVFVNKIAQKTNAYQQNNNILLGEGASVDTKPQLEIFADDVRCSHGCTVGQLDEDALFYLRARGISKKEAMALLLFAFANDAMQNIDIEQLRMKITRLLAEKLQVDLSF